MNKEAANQKFLEIMNKKDNLLSEEEIKLFKELLFKCDLKIQNNEGYNSLMYALIYNNDQKLNLNKEQWDYLIKNSGLTQQNYIGYTALIYALYLNKDQNLNLSEEQWDYLIKNSDLKQKNKDGSTPLIYALYLNKDQNLKLSEEQWDYLIKNSDLKQQNNYNWTPLMHALKNNKTQNLQLFSKQFKTMYDALNEEQKQITFQKLIHENVENSNQYFEEINLLLYDCEFQPNEKTLSWLKKNNLQDIIEMIEKRDVFFQLNQDFKEIDKQKKIATIKL